MGKNELFESIFNNYMIENDYSPRTRSEYYRRICMICDWCGKDFFELTREDAQAYFLFLQGQYYAKDISTRTIYSRMNTYSGFANHIQSNHLLDDYINPFTDIKVVTPTNNGLPIRNIPSSASVDRILDSAPDEMYYLVFTLAFRVGLFLSEIVALTLSHVVESNNVIFLHCNVRRTVPERMVPLPDDVGVLLKNYIAHMTYTDEAGHLFYNKYKNPLTCDNVESRIRKIVKSGGFDINYSMRDLRTRSILDMVSASISTENSLDAVADYVGLHDRRLRTYIKANSNIITSVPANLVNISIKPYNNKGGQDND